MMAEKYDGGGASLPFFRQVPCRQRDALTVFVPDGKRPSAEVQKYLDRAGSSQWFPQDGGYLVKLPNVFDSYDVGLFRVEKNAWNHEHCHRCGGTVDAGGICWMATGGDDAGCLFCDDCRQEMKGPGGS